MELNKVLERVRLLIAKAEASIAPGATPAEREATLIEQASARKMADALMLEYAIDEIQAQRANPASLHSKPGIIVIAVSSNTDLLGWVAQLSHDVAQHCRCRVRHYANYSREFHQWESKVYGFESDLRYFEILYTTLRLHMLGALDPKPDPTKSIEENSYILHNAGLNWYDIAQAYGWLETPTLEPDDPIKQIHPNGHTNMYKNKETGERLPWSKAVGVYQKAYQRAIEQRNEAPLKIPPGGMKTFRNSAAQGYVNRIWQRLAQAREGRVPGTEVLLRSRIGDIDDLFNKDNPDVIKELQEEREGKKRRPKKYVPPAFSEAGYLTGKAHADTASLNPETTGNNSKEIS